MIEKILQFPSLVFSDFWGLWGLVCVVIILVIWWGFRLYFFSQYHLNLWHKTLNNAPYFKPEDSSVIPASVDRKNNFKAHFLQAYRLTNWPLKAQVYLGGSALLAIFLGFLVGKTLGLLLGVMCALLLFTSGISLVFIKALDQKNKAIEQLPAFLEALSQSLQAGYSVTAALSFMAQELDPPLKQAIEQVNSQLSLQVPLETAFEFLAETFNQPEIDFLVEGTLVQVEIGGNLVVLFENMAQIIEEKLKLKRDIKSFTSQGKLSGIFIAGLWPVSLALFAWLSPQHTEILLFTPQGQILLFTSLFLELVGFFFIWRIIRVQL